MPANSVVWNTAGKGSKQATNSNPEYLPEDKLWEICKKHYNQMLPIMAEKVYKEKLQDIQAKDEVLARARQRKTQITERKRQEISSEAMLHYPVNAKRKLKENGPKKQWSTDEEDISQPWLCEETDPFITRFHNFEVPKRTRMPTNVKMYDGTRDPEDHLKIFQTAVKIKRWAMPTWCHMFNSTLIGLARGWFDKLPPESIYSYEIMRKAFLRNFSQQKKYIKDPVEIYHIKQREKGVNESLHGAVQSRKHTR
ncbi:reverse transcriptase domain-containing protein [Tanacetum coccineum]